MLNFCNKKTKESCN